MCLESSFPRHSPPSLVLGPDVEQAINIWLLFSLEGFGSRPDPECGIFFFFIVGVLRVIVISVMLDSPVSQTIKCLSAIKETQVQSLGREDPLEKEMATHSGIRAWKIPGMEEPGRLQSMGSQGVRHDSVTSLSESLLFP